MGESGSGKTTLLNILAALELSLIHIWLRFYDLIINGILLYFLFFKKAER